MSKETKTANQESIEAILAEMRRYEDERLEAERNKYDTAPFEILGKFEINSGIMRVTDPCYSKSTWCAGTLEVKNGEWTAAITRADMGPDAFGGIRVSKIMAWHSSASKEMALEASEETKIHVGVDSGQAGFFDDAMYPIGDLEPKRMAQFNGGKYNAEYDEFYERIGVFTLGPKQAGVIPFGAASMSGDGDGGYPNFVARDAAGTIVAVSIDFYPPYDEVDGIEND